MLRVDEGCASEQRVEALFNHAMTLSYLGDLDGCKEAYMEAHCMMKGWGELRREDEKRAELLKSTLTNLSSCLLKRGCKEEAIPYIEKALGAMEARMEFGLESVKEKREYFMVAEALAELYLELGMKDRSLEVWKRLRRTAYAEEGEVVEKEEKEMLAHLYRRHGQTLILSGKPDFLEEATTALEKSCSMYREMGDKRSLLDALDDLASARALHATDGSSRALSEVFAECLRLSEEVRGRDHAENARHRCNLAIMLCEKNEMDEAQRLAAEACSTLERLKMDREEAYLSSKRVLEAIKCLKVLSKNWNRLIKKNSGKRP